MTEQIATGLQCLDCNQSPGWDEFVTSMLKHHNVQVPEDFCPRWAHDLLDAGEEP